MDTILSLNAGHLPPFLNSNEPTLDPSLPLGIDSDAGGELYGFERVTALLADRPDAESIAKNARAFSQENDIPCWTITRLPIHDAVEAATFSLATG